jgi:hypothetical protein
MLERISVRSLCVALLLSSLGFAQQTGIIEGTLLDPGGATVPNAKVEAFDEARQILARETAESDSRSTLNAPNPGAVLTEATRGNAGTITATRDPRNIQIGMKVLF